MRLVGLIALLVMLGSILALPAPASACGTIGNATSVFGSATSAQLNGTVTSVGLPPPGVSVTFQWGTSPGLYPFTSPVIMVLAPGPVSYLANNLTPCTTYYYRIVFFEAGYCGLTTAPVMFQTPGCPTTAGAGSHGGYFNPNPGSAVSPSLISIKTAAVSSAKAGIGEPVTVNASVANTGGSNGSTRVTVYVNGKEATSQGIVVGSGQTSNLVFTVSGNEPGTYNVVVNNVPAGSFTVDYLAGNDALIYGLIAFFTVAIAGTIFLIARRRTV